MDDTFALYGGGGGQTGAARGIEDLVVNCTFYKTTKPALIMGRNVSPILFKNVTINGTPIQNAEQLKRSGFDLSVPVKFEP